MDVAMKNETYAVRLRERGQVTIPQPVRTALAAQDGDILFLVQIGDVVMLTPRQPRVPKLSQEFAIIMQQEGVTLADLLAGQQEERETMWRARQHTDA